MRFVLAPKTVFAAKGRDTAFGGDACPSQDGHRASVCDPFPRFVHAFILTFGLVLGAAPRSSGWREEERPDLVLVSDALRLNLIVEAKDGLSKLVTVAQMKKSMSI